MGLMPMNVLMIAHNGVLLSNQRKLEALVRQAALQGIDLDLTLLTPPQNLESAGWVKLERRQAEDFTIRVGWPWASMVRGRRYGQFYPFLSAYMKKAKPHLIDLWEEPWSLVSAQTLHLRNRHFPQVPIVHETEQNIHKDFPWPFNAIEQKLLQETAWFITRSEEAAGVIRNKGFAGPIDILPNGLSEEDFRPPDGVNLRERLDLGPYVVGYVGRLEEQKGLLDLLAAREKMNPRPDLLCVGVGPLADHLKQVQTGVQVHGPIPQKDLPSWYAAMDVLVLPSRTTPTWKEQFGRTLIESWAAGKPVVGSDSGAIPQVIGEAGLVFPEGDASALAACLARFQDPDLRAKFAALGKARLRERYTWDVIARRMVAIYRTLLDDREARHSCT